MYGASAVLGAGAAVLTVVTADQAMLLKVICVMHLVRESFFVRLAVALVSALGKPFKDLWLESCSCRLLTAAGSCLQRLYQGSLLCKVVSTDIIAESRACRLLYALLERLESFAFALVAAAKPLFNAVVKPLFARMGLRGNAAVGKLRGTAGPGLLVGAGLWRCLLFVVIVLLAAGIFFADPEWALKMAAGVMLAAAVFYRPEFGLYAAALLLPFTGFDAFTLLGVLTGISYFLHRFIFNRASGFDRAAGEDTQKELSPRGEGDEGKLVSVCGEGELIPRRGERGFTSWRSEKVGGSGVYRASLLLPVLLYMAVLVFGTVTSATPGGSAYELSIPVVSLLYMFLIVGLINERKKLNIFLGCLALSALAVAAYAVYDFYFGVTFIEMHKGWVDLTQNPSIRNRAYAVFENPNLLAQYFAMTIPVFAALTAVARRVGCKFLLLFIMVVCGFALVLTYSRGGWIGFMVAAVAMAVLKDRRFLLLFAAAGILGVFLAPHAVVERLVSIANLEDSSIMYRFDVWKSTLLMIRDYWLTGVGVGTSAFMRVYYGYMLNSANMPHAHNLYLQLLSEVGIFGLLAFGLIFYRLYQAGFRMGGNTAVREVAAVGAASPESTAREVVDREAAALEAIARLNYHRWLNAGLVGSFSGFLVESLFDYGLWYYKLGALFWILLAVFMVVERFYRREEKRIPRCQMYPY